LATQRSRGWDDGIVIAEVATGIALVVAVVVVVRVAKVSDVGKWGEVVGDDDARV